MTRGIVCMVVGVVLGLLLPGAARAEDRELSRAAFDAAVDRVGDVERSPGGLLGACPPPARPHRSDWHFFIGPYGWLASVHGTIVSGGNETDLSASFEDLLEHVQGGFQLYAGIWWKRLYVAFDGTWAELGATIEELPVDVDATVRQRLFDMRVGCEVYRRSLDGCLDPCREAWRRYVSADVFVGVRYWYTKTTVSFGAPAGLLPDLEGVDERWDPFLGVRFGWDVTRRWTVLLRGDVGGFGIGDAARFAWQVSGGVGYSFTPWMHLLLGWRAIAFDTVEGSGAARSGVRLVQHGPLVGLGFSF